VFEASHLVDLLLRENPGAASSGRIIHTSLDLELNRFAESVLQEHLATVRTQHVSNGALVILDNRTGEVLALVGSEDYFSPMAGQVNGAWAPRSPGSTLKPFTYLLAIEHGATPATIVADVPTEFVTTTGLFAPVNYNRRCYGPVRYRVALANSLNISAVKALESIGGPEPLQRLLQQCGLSTLEHSPNEYGLGLTIGNAGVRLLELANAYACLARLGEYQPFQLLARSGHGNPPPCRQVADAGAAYLIADILSDNDARTLAFGADSALRFDFPVACKTGTSSDFRDNWAFGYTPEFTVGVWIGNADGSPMQHVSGVTGAAPILHELFDYLHERYGTTWYSQPTNVVECWIQPITGKRLKELEIRPGLEAVKEKFLVYNLPSLENSSDYEVISPSKFAVRLGNEYRDWFASGDNWLGDAVALRRTEDPLRILFPPPGTVVYLDDDLPDRGRRLLLRASGPANVEWRSDSLSLTNTGNREMAFLTEGRHELSAHDPVSGTGAKTWIDVRAR
jgi:penicillin-binding protein 1C